MPEVKQERTGWRDEALSKRHRSWGWDTPMVDIDFLVTEYDRGQPIAIIEYKNEYAKTQYSSHASYRSIKILCDRADIFFFAVRYASDFSWWKVISLNIKARKFLAADQQMLDEQQYVSFLYKLRGLEMPDDLFPLIEI